MGSVHLILLSSSPINYFLINPRNIPNFNSQFLSPYSSKRTNSDVFRSRRFDFDLGFDFDDDFRKEKRKNWWSDDDSDSDDDDDEDEDDEFGFFKESNPIDWVFQVLKAFGWMVPALIISTVLGTGTNFGTNFGTNSLIMAVVLPLGQTALSLAIDKLVASPSSSSKSRRRYKTKPTPKPKPKPKPKPRPGPRSITRARAQESRSRSSLKRGGGDQSWRTANNSSFKKGGGTRSKFGGWDELDER